MPETPRPTLAAVVPATDEPPTLARCVAALRGSSEPPDELLVVERPAGAGPAAARNAGASEASSDLIAFIDADVEVDPDALARARRAFVADPKLVAVFGSYNDRPADSGAVSQFRNLLHHHVHTSSPGPAETFWAGLGAIRRDAFQACGGFDAERFAEPAVEDIELGMRLSAGGAPIVLDPAIRGTHLKSWSLPAMVRTDLLRRGIPWVRLQLEAGRSSAALNLAWRHRLSALASLVAVVAAIARRPLAAAGAVGALVALNASLYALLRRRGGISLALIGLPLHVLHHLVSIVAALAGAVLHLRDSSRSATTPASVATCAPSTNPPTPGPSANPRRTSPA
jgi:Glycosyl transferase family 2